MCFILQVLSLLNDFCSEKYVWHFCSRRVCCVLILIQFCAGSNISGLCSGTKYIALVIVTGWWRCLKNNYLNGCLVGNPDPYGASKYINNVGIEVLIIFLHICIYFCLLIVIFKILSEKEMERFHEKIVLITWTIWYTGIDCKRSRGD